MGWLLGISVVFNILLLIVIIAMSLSLNTWKANADCYRDMWEQWESRWYEAQAAIAREFNCHISPSGLIIQRLK